MPRPPRNTPPDTFQHIISRFVNREIRLVADEQRANYLRRVPRAMSFTDWSAIAYVLMGNHTHWAWRASLAPLESFYKSLHSGFGPWLNDQQHRLGPLFSARPKNVTIDDEHLARLIAYIHNNPVRAGVADDPAESSWSSHLAYLGEVPAPPWLDVDWALCAAGFDASKRGRWAFHDYVRARAGLPRDPELSGGDIAGVKSKVRTMVGAPAEIDATITPTGPRYGVLARPDTPLRPRWDGQVTTVVRAAAQAMKLTPAEMRSRTRQRGVADARRLALLVWRAHLGRPQAEMAAALGITDAAASQLLSSEVRIARLAEKAEVVGTRLLARAGAA